MSASDCKIKPLKSTNEICVFHTPANPQDTHLTECNILRDEYCDGTHKNCKFYKTFAAFSAEQDEAILMNRQKGNCANCKYVRAACQLACELAGANEND